MRAGLSGACCHSLVLAEAFPLAAFAGSGYNYFMACITGHSSSFLSWNSFLGLGWEGFFFSHEKRQPLRTWPKAYIYTNLPNKSECQKCNGSANVYCEKWSLSTTSPTLKKQISPLLPGKNPLLCCVLCVNGEKPPLNWHWSTGLTNPKPYRGHVSSSESWMALLIRLGVYASVY